MSTNISLIHEFVNPEEIKSKIGSENPIFQRKVGETQKLIDNFKDKMTNYPKRISHEASTVICVLLSMEPNPQIKLNILPLNDQAVFKEILPSYDMSNVLEINVRFDDNYDFMFTFRCEHIDDSIVVNVINEIIHPDPKNQIPYEVPIEKNGDKIVIGKNIILDKKLMQHSGGIDILNNKKDPSSISKSASASAGKNAFEIRSDVLKMALEWSIYNKQIGSDEGVLNVAKKFYSFVENKR